MVILLKENIESPPPPPLITGDDPPPFTHYSAEYSIDSNGYIISHDSHLNSDGEALYRFLLQHSLTPPKIVILCKGTHSHTHTNTSFHFNHHNHNHDHHNSHGHSHGHSHGRHFSRSTSHTDSTIVTDFSFSIDLSPHLVSGPIHFSLPDSAPAYRGRMVREVEPNGVRRKATRAEIRAFKDWSALRDSRGWPPWLNRDQWHDDPAHLDPPQPSLGTDAAPDLAAADTAAAVLRSSRTLREWADEYCASPRILKEFRYQKAVYGWDLAALQRAIAASIRSAPYSGTLTVTLRTTHDRIVVRPPTRVARWLMSSRVLCVLLWLTLLYPFVWLWRRVHPRGGGVWGVCGGAWAFKRWDVDQLATEDSASAVDSPPPVSFAGPSIAGRGRVLVSAAEARRPRWVDTPRGPARVLGLREGEWFHAWEDTIRRAVVARHVSTVPLTEPDGAGVAGHVALDGY